MKEIYLEKRKIYSYPDDAEIFAPSKQYPEYPFQEISENPNEVYDMVRRSMIGMELDQKNIGLPTWNPLGDYIKPGDSVVIKPNMVKHCESLSQYECTLTHPSVVRVVIDYCIIAKAGKIIVGDAPIQGADMNLIKEGYFYNKLIAYYKEKGVAIEFADFRDLIVKKVNGIIVTQKEKNPASKEYITVSLGKESKHYEDYFHGKYETCGYVNEEINLLHHEDRHDYVIAREILEADCIINLPKPKTHRFAGITGAQKNFVGSCSDKESLPHFKAGSSCVGGDETNNNSILSKLIAYFYRKYLWECKKNRRLKAYIYIFIYRCLCVIKGNKFYVHGAWYGNDTIWRTIIDLNKIMLYTDKKGKLIWNVPQRKILTIGDMIIAGEKEGPLNPTAKPLGIILISRNAAVFDYTFCKITGFDEKLIPTVFHSIRNTKISVENWEEIRLSSNVEEFNQVKLKNMDFKEKFAFEPHPFWKEIL